MADILHFPGRRAEPRAEPPDTAGKSMQQAGALLALTVAALLDCRDDRDERIKVIGDSIHRLKLANLLLDLALVIEEL